MQGGENAANDQLSQHRGLPPLSGQAGQPRGHQVRVCALRMRVCLLLYD
jgi:hypothetical protein